MKKKHDRFFREAFSDVRVAHDAMCQLLPGQVKACLDLAGVRLEKTAFIDESGVESVADVLLSAAYRGQTNGRCYLLIEHQRKERRDMAWRCFDLTAKVFRHHLKQQPNPGGKLPLVFTAVVYNGVRKWTSSLDLADHLDVPPEISQKTFYHQPTLIDLRETKDEELKRHGLFGLTNYLLKHVDDANLSQQLELLVERLAIIPTDRNGLLYLELALHYLISAGNLDPVRHEFMAKIRNLHDQKTKEQFMPRFMTIEMGWERDFLYKHHPELITKAREQVRREEMDDLRAQAIRELREEIRLEHAQKMLNAGIERSVISKIVNVDEEIIECIELGRLRL
ncbi:Rpn family recombination-promoting nuclease/putative transposase [Acanthopleuribacter pedis]|uniref:Rpn family recombination-promoting nuclease/putative transposase n=1 Tax=Acanthopleuribacter pedis TaxID=442870 RepID=A0A8J7QA14_9BACT|nr:Rpn family recombination-promoting nuclease/putative transposase [Acanthopleuribacter pedis]MBO1320547.1 Rpn family recombination-promoting nuclease/putative transposase [Acanthopleuribacter pedis]